MMKNKECSGRIAYPDIIDLPHWQSQKRKHMSLYDRAAQFAPFSALSGYSDMIAEESRQTEPEAERDLEMLDRKLGIISHLLAGGTYPNLSFTVFAPDDTKEGGEYRNVTGTVMKIDGANRRIVLEETTLDIQSIHDIHGSALDDLDDMIP